MPAVIFGRIKLQAKKKSYKEKRNGDNLMEIYNAVYTRGKFMRLPGLQSSHGRINYIVSKK